MKVNKLYFLPVLLLVSLSAAGQKFKTATADKYFNQFQYVAAAQAYEQVVKLDTRNVEAMEKLVTCYTKLNNPVKTEYWLAKVLKTPQVEPKVYKNYATVLAANGKYQEALNWFDKSYEITKDEESYKWKTSYQDLQQFYKDSAFYTFDKVTFNSNASDFSPAFYKGGVVFCSARDNGKISKLKYEYNNTWFIDIYYVKDSVSKVMPLNEDINTRYHEGPVSFTPDERTIYFTRNNYLKKNIFSSDGVSKLQIFYAAIYDGKISNVQPFALNNKEYSVGQPALVTADLMYFVSDMPGGFGGTDLYKTERIDGKWQKPVNLGPSINTSGNEMFPYVDETGILYFASNGHPGLGGLDVFYTASVGNENSVINMGFPVNTARDDFGFIVQNKKGYLSSNRKGDSGNDDIFKFKIHEKHPLVIAQLQAKKSNINPDSTGLGEVKGIAMANKTDSANADTPTKPTEVAGNNLADTNKKTSNPNALTREEALAFANSEAVDIASDKKDTPRVIAGKTNTTTKNKNKTLPAGSKNPVNAGNNKLKNSALANKNSKDNLKAETAEAKASRIRKVAKMSTEFTAGEIGEIIELEIKFDLDKTTIRSDAAEVLDGLVTFMENNPGVKVELGAHTDLRGSDKYNLKLSQGRAESVVRYVKARGIRPDRLLPIGFGERLPVIPDAQDEEEHQANRRTTARIFANESQLMAYQEQVAKERKALLSGKYVDKNDEVGNSRLAINQSNKAKPGAASFNSGNLIPGIGDGTSADLGKTTGTAANNKSAEGKNKELVTSNATEKATPVSTGNSEDILTLKELPVVTFSENESERAAQMASFSEKLRAQLKEKESLIEASAKTAAEKEALKQKLKKEAELLIEEMLAGLKDPDYSKTIAANKNKTPNPNETVGTSGNDKPETAGKNKSLVESGENAKSATALKRLSAKDAESSLVKRSGGKFNDSNLELDAEDETLANAPIENVSKKRKVVFWSPFRANAADDKTAAFLADAEADRFFIITDAFISLERAERYLEKAAEKGDEAKILMPLPGNRLHRIAVADYTNREEAEANLAEKKRVYGDESWILGVNSKEVSFKYLNPDGTTEIDETATAAKPANVANTLKVAEIKPAPSDAGNKAEPTVSAPGGVTEPVAAEVKKEKVFTLKDIFVVNTARKNAASAKLLEKVSGYSVNAKSNRYYIIAAGFSTLANADKNRLKIGKSSANAKIIMPYEGSKLYRIAVADFTTMEEARQQLPRLKRVYGLFIWVLRY